MRANLVPARTLIVLTGLLLLSVLLALPAAAQTNLSGTLLVVNKSGDSVSLISLPDIHRVATVTVGHGPHEIAVSPDGKTAVVSNYGDARTSGHSLSVIDIPAARVVRTIDLGVDKRPHGLAWVHEGQTVAVTTEQSKRLLVIDIDNGKIVKRIPLMVDLGHMVAVARETDTAFVSSIGTGGLTRIELSSSDSPETKPSGRGAEGIDISTDGSAVWVTNREDDTVSVFDTSSLKLLQKFPAKGYPIRVKLTPDGRYALVTLMKAGQLAVFDARRFSEVKRIPLTGDYQLSTGRYLGGGFGNWPMPIGLLVFPDGKHAAVANTDGGTVQIVDIETGHIAVSITAGKEPDGLGYSKRSVRH